MTIVAFFSLDRISNKIGEVIPICSLLGSAIFTQICDACIGDCVKINIGYPTGQFEPRVRKTSELIRFRHLLSGHLPPCIRTLHIAIDQ